MMDRQAAGGGVAVPGRVINETQLHSILFVNAWYFL